MKQLAAGLAIVVWCFLLGCDAENQDGGRQREPIKLGAALPLTGSGAVWGKDAQSGMRLAVEEINEAGGVRGQPLAIVYEDTQSVPEVGVSAIRKLIMVDKVPAVIGCITSSTTLAMAPIAAQNRVVLFSPGASSPKLSQAGPFFFRNFPSDAIEAPEIARMVRHRLGLDRVAILLVNNEFGKGHELGFRSEFERLGGTIVAAESFPQDVSDFRAQIAKIQLTRPEGIFLPGYPRDMATALSQLAEAGVRAQIIAPSALIDENVIRLAGGAAEGVIFADQRPPDANSPVVRHFRNAYRTTYSREPGIVADTAYDAVRILAKGVEAAGPHGPAIREELAKMKDFPGAAGPTTFDERGDIIKTPIFRKVESGKIVEFWNNPPARQTNPM